MPESALYAVDMGTTRTRVWLLRGKEIEAHATGDFGVRNVAAGETRDRLEARLILLLDEAFAARHTRELAQPTAVAAAGMITSPQGLAEVPHLVAPVSATQLAAGIVERALTTRPDLRLRLVPGVRTAGLDAFDSDVMRGEETLCIGLLATGRLKPGEALLTLGSHWKWIATDAESRIAASSTTITGELIHAVQANTLLAASLPQHRPESFDAAWLERGRAEARRFGLGRALFCIRLLEQRNEATEQQRLSFLYGAMLNGELGRISLQPRPQQVLVSGPPELAELWRQALAVEGPWAEVLEESDREEAYLHGLLELVK